MNARLADLQVSLGLRPPRQGDRFLETFSDYTEYLKQVHLERKARRKSWSYSAWAKQLGLKSSSTLIMILQKQRHPGPKLISKLIHDLGLSHSEAESFVKAVQLSKINQDSIQIPSDFQATGRLHNEPRRILDAKRFRLVCHWYSYAIREMVNLVGFKEELNWIAARLGNQVSPSVVRSVLQTLLSLGLLVRDAKGNLKLSSYHSDTYRDIPDLGLKRFHEEALTLARKKLRTLEPGQREISGTTFAMKLKDLPEAKEWILAFQKKFCEQFEAQEGDEVFHLEMAFFPFTEGKTKAK